MICAKCEYQFCWICGAQYKVDHFDRSNVFGCQGLQTSDPTSACRMTFMILIQLFLIPLTLLFHPVHVCMQAFCNPFNMPKKYRFLCFCVPAGRRNCPIGFLLLIIFLPIVLAIGLIAGVVNMVIFTIPAVLCKVYKLLKMVTCWRSFCCLNRHKK